MANEILYGGTVDFATAYNSGRRFRNAYSRPNGLYHEAATYLSRDFVEVGIALARYELEPVQAPILERFVVVYVSTGQAYTRYETRREAEAEIAASADGLFRVAEITEVK